MVKHRWFFFSNKVSMSLLPVNCRVYEKFKSQISGDHHLLNLCHKGYFLTASVMDPDPLYKNPTFQEGSRSVKTR